MYLRFVTIRKYAEASGYSAKAIERKIGSGVWTLGNQYVKSPDGRIMVDTERAQSLATTPR